VALTTLPGAILPLLVTVPVTVEPVITIEVVAWPAGFVTLATVWFVIACPARAGAERSSAATEVVARSKDVRAPREAEQNMGTEETPLGRELEANLIRLFLS
jgi:hypothetical protein